jgi:hypothetical protein
MVSDISDEPLEEIDGSLIKRFLCRTERDCERKIGMRVSAGRYRQLPQMLNVIIEHGFWENLQR